MPAGCRSQNDRISPPRLEGAAAEGCDSPGLRVCSLSVAAKQSANDAVSGWLKWHERYDDPDSSLARRLGVVQREISNFLDGAQPGPIRVVAMCAGDGRDLLGVLKRHVRARDVSGRLVELDPRLVERARCSAPVGLEVIQADAGISDVYEGACPADLVMTCGVFGHVSDEDIRTTIGSWRFLLARGGTVIWTRGALSGIDLRPLVRVWIQEAGFHEVAFHGEPSRHGVGVAKLAVEPEPFRRGVAMFRFGSWEPTA